MALAYDQRPKFFRAEHSATAEGEKCSYGPTLLSILEFGLNLFNLILVLPPAQKLVKMCDSDPENSLNRQGINFLYIFCFIVA